MTAGSRLKSQSFPKEAGESAAPASDRQASQAADERPVRWLSAGSTFGQALLGGALLWFALPPLDLGWLGWLAPLPWAMLVRRSTLPGRRPYAALWCAGLLFWLAALHWLTLPHWATGIGWVALSIYLACYLPLFVGLSRVAVHRLRMPLYVAAPIVWTGLEYFRGHFLSGFLLGALAHTQHRWPIVIQISDLAGAYGLSFAMLLVAACVAASLPGEGRRFNPRPLLPAGVVLVALLAYGQFRLGQAEASAATAKVALIQGSIDTEFKFDPDRPNRMYQEYLGLSRQALAEHPDLDLIVWPETMYSWPLIEVDSPLADDAPQGSSVEDASASNPNLKLAQLKEYALRSREGLAAALAEMAPDPAARPHWLVGVDVSHARSLRRTDRYNSAAFVAPGGEIVGRYDKMHPVMFGEYVPLGETFPWLYSVTPLSGGLSAGERPQAFPLGELRLAPNICYETVLPHLIRRQVADLAAAGEEPDVLVNLTNDGWFWGSAELDMHLVSGVFRAVECRKPLLIAANTGFSAWIDAEGRLLERGPRRDRGIVIARIGPDRESSLYLRWGDWLAGACFAGCLALSAVGLWRRNAKLCLLP